MAQPPPPRTSRRPSSRRCRSSAPTSRQITRDATFEDARRRLARPRRARRRSSRSEYGVELKGDDVGKIKTVGDAIDLVVSARGMRREVVVTGVGAVTPLGVGARTLHERWTRRRVRHRGRRGRVHASSTPPTHLSVKEARRADRFTQFAHRRRRRGARRGRLGRTSCPTTPTRIGSIIGTGIGGIGTLERGNEIADASRAPRRSRRSSVPLMMGNAAAAARVACATGCAARAYGTVSACSARRRRDRRGDADDRSPATPTRSSPAARRRR